ncbi:MAG: AIPR family protein [Fimbriimonadaceae bacterium]|nr:MAG: AIPR family protein [Fimbriimonadaceae bacterium]
MPLTPQDLAKGIELFQTKLEEIQDSEPEVTDVHRAFDYYCLNKYTFGSAAEDVVTDGKNDRGIDFYSTKDHKYRIGQCKMPDQQYLDANPTTPRIFGQNLIHEARTSLAYLLDDADSLANDRVKRLYAILTADKADPDFHLTFFIIIYGRTSPQADTALETLQSEYRDRRVTIVLKQLDELVDEFIVGAHSYGQELRIKLTCDPKHLLRLPDSCYLLTSAGDIYDAFRRFGWRLFDLNLRYEIRNSPVNSEIVQSLSTSKGRKQFHYLNNGLIIVVKQYTINEARGELSLNEPQIVNGLQTVASINNAVQDKQVTPEELVPCRVQVRVVQTNDSDLVSNLVRATNNQNPMSPRSLRSNSREQKELRRSLESLPHRWFLQVKDGEWESLNSEGQRFFKDVAGYPVSEFRVEPQKKSSGRVLDNQDLAKAWLAFIGFGDKAGDRTAHYFASPDVYRRAFQSSPNTRHWSNLASIRNFDGEVREENLVASQGGPHQYIFAYFLWCLIREYVPSNMRIREEALERGIAEHQLERRGGSIQSSEKQIDEYLVTDTEYQTLRLMANMKELLVEAIGYILAKKYLDLDDTTCKSILETFDAREFVRTGRTKEIGQKADSQDVIPPEDVFARLLGFLKYVCRQHWVENQKHLLAISRIRTVVLRREFMRDFKGQIDSVLDMKGIERPWKPEGQAFLASLPGLPKA